MTHVDGGGVPAGTQLNGIYEIEKRIATGGMGEVYVARDQSGKKFAIKMILPEHANNQVILDLFHKEADTLHDLNHPAIVRYYVFTTDPALGRPYLAMEFAGGPSLADRLRDGPMNESDLKVLRNRVAGGLHAAHQLGIIHRDISPDNIILVDGEVEKAKIIDFGIAKTQSAEGTLIGSGFAGKLNYVSPEQLGLEGGVVTGKSDIYSLGLVFAEAATSRPLPMGGSQVEVVDKRRTIPDLSQIPAFIRPLIESMVQPSPANRPYDMDAVANWDGAASSTPAADVASDTTRRRHPRERRREQQQKKEKNGAPWLWIGLGGVAVAGAVAAGIFVLDPLGWQAGGSDTDGISQPSDPGSEASLSALNGPITAGAGTVGSSYVWVAPRFDYTGDRAALQIGLDGDLPPGLSFSVSEEGVAQISGEPTAVWDGTVTMVVTSPEGQTVRQLVELSIVEAQPEPGADSTDPGASSLSPGGLAVPESNDGTVSLLNSQDTTSVGGSSSGLSGGDSGIARPSIPPTDSDPTAGSNEPGVNTGLPGGLAAPSSGGTGELVLVPGDAGGQIGTGLGVPKSDLGDGGGDVARPSIPPVDNDPTAGSTEPGVNTGLPGGLAAPSAGGAGSGLADTGGADGAIALPSTGGGLSQPGGGSTQDLAAIAPTSRNQPPTIEDRFPGSVDAVVGEAVNIRIGSFFDEAGPSAIELRIEGQLPNGFVINKASGGIAQLYGQSTEFGEYSVEVAAVDPEGLVSKPIMVNIRVSSPTATRDVRDYILGYDGGSCFLSRPVQLGPQVARIEVFASDIPPVLTFDEDFKREQGFEAQIGLRLISAEQCALVNALDKVGAQALDNSLQIGLTKDELQSGDLLEGEIIGGRGARLFLFDHLGATYDLNDHLTGADGSARFSLPIHADGSQILVAARPREGASIDSSASLEQLLGAAQRGDASLALGFFTIGGG